MESPMSLGLEAMVSNLNAALEHHPVELSFHHGRRITSVEVSSVRRIGSKSLEVHHTGGTVLIQRICRLEDWPADDKMLRTYALRARVQPSIACFYIHDRLRETYVEEITMEEPLAPNVTAP